MSSPGPETNEPENAGDSRRNLGLGTAVGLVLAFLFVYHFVGVETWGHGKETFPRMLVLVAIVLVASRARVVEARLGTSRMLGLVALGASSYLAHGLYVGCRDAVANASLAGSAVDIARNVYEAGTQWLAGHNPYVERCQLGHVVGVGPHVTMSHGVLRMYGLEYRYGFPYFPVMMLAYLPFRGLVDGLHAIRVGNAFYLLIGTVGASWLAARSVAAPNRTLAAGLASVAYLGIDVLAPEHFQLAVTDVCIAAIAVLGFVALAHERAMLAGVLLGLAQGAKLLPGPLLVLPALAYLETRRERVRLGGAYLVVSVLCVVPAMIPNVESFLSSTIAFYLTYHGVGDDTSLYWYLPEWAKGPFLALGFVLALGFALAGFKQRPATAAQAAGYAWVAYLLFTTFNRMTHLNYLWGVHTLGAAALAASAFTPRARSKAR